MPPLAESETVKHCLLCGGGPISVGASRLGAIDADGEVVGIAVFCLDCIEDGALGGIIGDALSMIPARGLRARAALERTTSRTFATLVDRLEHQLTA